jgi:NAD(P)-dependent dehydrogenase (short-subunit alcohol dehydrogenase family)
MTRPFAERSSMAGRVALVTGGSGHVGRTTSETLAELGAHVVALDRDTGPADEQAPTLVERFGVQATSLVVDLEDEQAVVSSVGEVERRFGRLDVVVHTAALVGTTPLEGWAVPFEQQSVATWRRAVEVNLTSCFALVQAAAPLLAASPGGAVVLVSSIYGMLGPDQRLYEGTGMGNPAAYSASKGGLLALMRWLATTMAPQVRVNAISPGGIARGQDEQFVDRYRQRTPLQRLATEDDLRGAIGYLASDLSSYVTGHNLVVDGGWSAW